MDGAGGTPASLHECRGCRTGWIGQFGGNGWASQSNRDASCRTERMAWTNQTSQAPVSSGCVMGCCRGRRRGTVIDLRRRTADDRTCGRRNGCLHCSTVSTKCGNVTAMRRTSLPFLCGNVTAKHRELFRGTQTDQHLACRIRRCMGHRCIVTVEVGELPTDSDSASTWPVPGSRSAYPCLATSSPASVRAPDVQGRPCMLGGADSDSMGQLSAAICVHWGCFGLVRTSICVHWGCRVGVSGSDRDGIPPFSGPH